MSVYPGELLFDLNCDLGEGEQADRTRDLISLVTSANIACGGHAGDEVSMRYCLEHARKRSVGAGAHPGWPDRANRGRADVPALSPDQLARMVDQQVNRLATIARAMRIELHHVKLHGALYHRVDADAALAAAYVRTVRAGWPQAILYAPPEGSVARTAGDAGMAVWPEAFLDRNYLDDGTLVPRGKPNAMLLRPAAVLERLDGLITGAGIRTVNGNWLAVVPRTLCVHSDTPGAATLLRAVRDRLEAMAKQRQ